MNFSISCSKFPTAWKLAKIYPIFKSGKRDNRSNYHPISILSVLSKIFEKHVHIHLYQFLTTYNLLHLAQSVFRKLHSCETTLAKLASKFASIMNKGEITGIILLDLCKAFNMVDHKLLLKKLSLYKLSNHALKWFESYLTNRKQVVNVKSAVSESADVVSGVPQGSILGPLLFIFFMNDLALETENTEFDMYADDSRLGASAKTLTLVEQKLSSDAAKVEDWCDTSKMAINADKTKCMILTTTQRFNRLNVKELNITIKNRRLNQVTTENLLGIKVDQFLSWKDQISKVHSRVSRLLGRFPQIKPFLPTYAHIKYCNAFILPHLEYCCTVWSSAQTSKLLVLQKRAIRMIFDLPDRETTESYWHKLKWMKIYVRIHYKKVKMIYKALNGLASQYLRGLYTLTSGPGCINAKCGLRESGLRVNLWVSAKK